MLTKKQSMKGATISRTMISMQIVSIEEINQI